MKIFSLALLLLWGIFQFSVEKNSPVECFSGETKQKINPIDSIYNQLIADKADEILVYKELFWGDKSKGVITWKKLDSLHGIVIESGSGVINYKKEVVICRKQLEEAASLYFTNEGQIADTLPQNPLGVSHDFEISIRSYQNGKQRNHKLLASQVIFFKTPFTIGKIANLFNDIIYFEHPENGKINGHEAAGHLH